MGADYMSDIYSLTENPRTTRRSVYKLNLPFKLTNMGQNGVSYIAPKIWNNLPSECKLENSQNKFKHKIKKMFFYKLQRDDNDIYLYY